MDCEVFLYQGDIMPLGMTHSVEWRCRLLSLLMALAVNPAAAEGLSFDAALRAADVQAPQLQARQATLSGAQETASAAGALPDPKAFVGLDNLPIDGPDQFSTRRDFMTMQKIGLMQERGMRQISWTDLRH
ncbi:MAG: hypothetical protein WBJ03_14155 [Moraxellaceae bacterium]